MQYIPLLYDTMHPPHLLQTLAGLLTKVLTHHPTDPIMYQCLERHERYPPSPSNSQELHHIPLSTCHILLTNKCRFSGQTC